MDKIRIRENERREMSEIGKELGIKIRKRGKIKTYTKIGKINQGNILEIRGTCKKTEEIRKI